MSRFSLINFVFLRKTLFSLSCIALLFIAGCGEKPEETTDSAASSGTDDEIVIAMLPKLVNIDYFDACQKGAEKAAADLGVKLVYDGPQQPSGVEQNKFIETWIRQKVDAICIAPNQPKSIKRFVEQAGSWH
ncbi:MAG: substrate-binding domain-containing protein [Planctomycetaceae bacterium]